MGHSVHNLLTPSVHNLMTLTVHEVLTLYTNYADLRYQLPQIDRLELGNRLAASSRILLSTGNCAAQDRAPYARQLRPRSDLSCRS